PFNWRHSSANSSWVRRYTLAIALMAVFYFGYQLTLWMPFHLIHQVYVGLFFVYYTYFELEERLMPVTISSPSPSAEECEERQAHSELSDNVATDSADAPDHLWRRIKYELDDKQTWKNPELTVDMLARLVGSNKTYVHQAFATYGGTNYKDYINRRRVDFIAAQLRSKPNQNLENLFYRAGYRSRTTAGRNFKDIMGISPTDYAASL
ncbi:MAG: helix-turn-helix domain-containing protein, partial [Prevotella sp.]|nr:helix-turn-helix domain-containing protein [Prevotella sp.]